MKTMKYCECDYNLFDTSEKDGILICKRCDKPIECEFEYLDGEKPHPAELIHVDYFVCKKHLHIAVDNVGSRGY